VEYLSLVDDNRQRMMQINRLINPPSSWTSQLFMAAQQGRPLYIAAAVSIFLLLPFFPRLFSAVANWMSTILLHMMWP